jgi:hypothetical protein
MHPHNTVFNLAAIAIILPRCARRAVPTLHRSRFVNQTDRLGVGMVSRHDLLATIPQLGLIPLDRFQKSL